MNKPLIIVAASARAAAASARRAGFTPYCADLFADADLRRMATAVRTSDYPQGALKAIRRFPDAPVVYGGAFENFPDVVDDIARCCRVLGNSGETLRAIRDPFRTHAALEGVIGTIPEVSRTIDEVSRDGCWLMKPLRGSAGIGIQRVMREMVVSEGVYFQEIVDGDACSALFVASGGQVRLIGVTRQLVGDSWTVSRPFQYCGSIGPLPLSEARRDNWMQIASCLTDEFQLRGLFGIDAIDDGNAIWPVEINPRFTASAEVLERGGCTSLIGLHVQALVDHELPSPVLRRGKIHGKAILFARQDLVVTAQMSSTLLKATDQSGSAIFADIPNGETEIGVHQPVMTLFASGNSIDDVERSLRSIALETESRLYD